MNQDPRLRRGAHRTSRAASATLLPSLLAILAVTSLITALYVWRGEEARPPSAAASGSSPTPHSSTTSPATSAADTTTATTATTATTEPATTTTSAATGHKTKTAPGAQLRASIAIVVLNQTGQAGLAAAAASRLRA
jgi:cytoskeletal protein RodZ